MGDISSGTLLYLLIVCVCVCAVKWVQCCGAVACGAVYAAVLSVLSVSVWLTGVRLVMASQGCCGWDVPGQGEMEERDGERICHFIQAFPYMTRILTPVLSISISRWLAKELLRCRRVHIKTVFVRFGTVCTWMAYTSVNTWNDAVPPLCKISISSQWWSDVAVLAINTVQLSLLPLHCPLAFILTHWLGSGHQNADCFPKTWFHKWKNSICFPTASHMAAIAAHMNWSR